MTNQLDTLIVVRDQSAMLIRAEVRAMEHRASLERACREAILKLGADINEVSAESGLTVAEIQRILDEMPALSDNDLADLIGLR